MVSGKNLFYFLFVFFSLLLLPSVLLASADSRGGSNYFWYQVDNCTSMGRDPYGVISNYSASQSKSIIDQQLDMLFAAGQRRLRVGIFHQRGLETGTVMDSTGGNISTQNRQKLTDFLAAIKSKGFHAITFSFHPINFNNPKTWDQWYETRFQENWNLIYNIRPIVANAGIQYRIDLMNEGVPRPDQDIVKQYARKMWLNYTYVFGKNDTVGFSFNGNPS